MIHFAHMPLFLLKHIFRMTFCTVLELELINTLHSNWVITADEMMPSFFLLCSDVIVACHAFFLLFCLLLICPYHTPVTTRWQAKQ